MKLLHSIFFFLLFAVTLAAQTVQDSVTIVTANWTVDTISNGIISKHSAFDDLYGVKQNVNIIEINPKVKVNRIAIARLVPNEITSAAAKAANAIVAINGSFFDIKNENSVCYLQLGKLITDTTTDKAFSLNINGAVFVKNGKMKLISWTREKENKHKPRKESILASGPMLIKNGKVCDLQWVNQKFVETCHPRSAIAITKDKKILFVIFDGRAPGNADGVSLPQLAHFFRVLACKSALNLDGGGSTTLWSEKAPDNGVLNCPSDNKRFDHLGERKVENIIYVY